MVFEVLVDVERIEIFGVEAGEEHVAGIRIHRDLLRKFGRSSSMHI